MRLYPFQCAILFLLSAVRRSQGGAHEQHYGEEAIVTVDGDGRPCATGTCRDDDDDDDRHSTTATPLDRHQQILHDCQDLRPYCADRAHTCQSNWKFMHPHCPQTCHVCHNLTRTVRVGEGSNQDRDAENVHQHSTERQYNNAAFATTSGLVGIQGQEIILDVAGGDLGVAQLLDPAGTGEHRNEIIDAIENARAYVHDVVMTERRYEKVRDACKTKSAHCAYFAVRVCSLWLSL